MEEFYQRNGPKDWDTIEEIIISVVEELIYIYPGGELTDGLTSGRALKWSPRHFYPTP